ncbi:MAG: hypothetical protein HDR26_02365 [Lachnospiraceae bacterium]|nr:hypothetical protein [Lachnospiraceae bacterium]
MKSIWKKKTWTAALIACLLFVTACGKSPAAEEDAEGDELQNPYTMPDSLENNEDIENARKYIWQEYLNQVKNDEARAEEIKNRAMTFGEATMKYGILVLGDPGESGYPVYIALHGGGQSDTPTMNDSQWMQMGMYYKDSVRNGIYVYPRGVRDTWDCHFNPESYPLYDRLIENLIAFYDADPNRIYLTGFSAGGDGVYAIVAKMADRFGAANMSAGHPNGLPLWNLYNMPIQLQVGEKDADYDRNICTAQYGLLLDSYQEQLGGGYIHNTYIHKGAGHNFYDNTGARQKVMEDSAQWLETGESPVVEVNANAVRFMEQYVRDPLPERVVWDLSQRADQRTGESFYWLRADRQLTEGRIIASYDRESNSVNVEECSVAGEITILLSNDMLDLFSPITINTPAGSQTVTVTPDFDLLYETTAERGDYNYQFAAKITVTF